MIILILGDCWFVAGAAVIATHPSLFKQVVPADQGFDENYAGMPVFTRPFVSLIGHIP